MWWRETLPVRSPQVEKVVFLSKTFFEMSRKRPLAEIERKQDRPQTLCLSATHRAPSTQVPKNPMNVVLSHKDDISHDWIAMSICIPIKELKDTAAFAAAVESAGAPVIVTKHGREEFVSMSMEVYEGMRRQAALAELYRVVDRGLRDVEQGRVRDAGNALAELRERHGL